VKGFACGTNADFTLHPREHSSSPGAGGLRNAELRKKQKTLLLIIGTDSLGKDEDLGKKLVKGFFDTMKVYKQFPHTIFFLNAGVKLTTVNEEVAAVLKDIEASGVEIYSCGTCLKHYDLEAALKVGKRGTTNQIVEGMRDFDKVVWV
jgi:selenium metabolism protein YedF